MKILLQTTKCIEKEVDCPFYAYCQDEDSEIFVKIDEKTFSQIIIFQYGKVEIYRGNNHNEMAAVWYRNKSNKEKWIEAVKQVKQYISNFN